MVGWGFVGSGVFGLRLRGGVKGGGEGGLRVLEGKGQYWEQAWVAKYFGGKV